MHENQTNTKEVTRNYTSFSATGAQLSIVYSYFMWLMKQNQLHDHVLETEVKFSEIFNPAGNRIRAFSDSEHKEYREVVLVLGGFVQKFNVLSGLDVNFEPSENVEKVVSLMDKKDLIVSNPDIKALTDFYRYLLYLFIEPCGDDGSRRITLSQILHGDMSDFGTKANITSSELDVLKKHIAKDVAHLFESTNIKGA